MSKIKSVESRKSKVKSGDGLTKSKITQSKSKIVQWEFVTILFDVYVLPSQVKRVHSPLEPSLDVPDSGFYYNIPILHLRPCVQGMDEDCAIVKHLYCTRDGRFFVRGKDGWNEVKPMDIKFRRGYKNNAGGGGYDCPLMRNFGAKTCHKCVAFAWLDVPEDVKLQMVGVDAPTKWEVDHLNGDHMNWKADNLQWVTAEDNRRRAKISRRLKKAAIDPKILTRTLLLGIFSLPLERIEEFVGLYQAICSNDPSPLSHEAIRLDVAEALDKMRSKIIQN